MPQTVDNPYRAPRADVDDFEPSEENDRGPRPPQVAVAVVMFWVVLVMQIASLVYNWQFMRYATGVVFILACVVSGFWVLSAWLVAMIERGLNWARITYLVLYLLIFLPFYALTTLVNLKYTRSPMGALPALAQATLQLIALLLLFAGAARHWYRGRAR